MAVDFFAAGAAAAEGADAAEPQEVEAAAAGEAAVAAAAEAADLGCVSVWGVQVRERLCAGRRLICDDCQRVLSAKQAVSKFERHQQDDRERAKQRTVLKGRTCIRPNSKPAAGAREAAGLGAF